MLTLVDSGFSDLLELPGPNLFPNPPQVPPRNVRLSPKVGLTRRGHYSRSQNPEWFVRTGTEARKPSGWSVWSGPHTQGVFDFMNKVLVALLLLRSLVNVEAQGTVNFSNLSTARITAADRLVRFDPVTVGTSVPNPFGTNNAPVVGTNFVAQLFYGASTASESSLVPVSSAPATFRSSTSPNPGTWFGGQRTLGGFGGGDLETMNLQVRVWDITYASSWDEYLSHPQGLAGKSSVFSYTIIGTAPFATDMQNFEGFSISIPEPLPLWLIAAILVLSIRRRTQASQPKSPG
jgi:hypothetical protein